MKRANKFSRYYKLLTVLFIVLLLLDFWLINHKYGNDKLTHYKIILAIVFGQLILNQWKISSRLLNKEFDYGVLFLLLSQVIWALNGFINIGLEKDIFCPWLEEEKNSDTIRAIFSGLNSICFLMVIPFLDIKKNEKNVNSKLLNILWRCLYFIKEKKKKFLYFICILIICLIIWELNSPNIAAEIDFVFSLVTIIVLGAFLYLVFIVREMKEYLPLIFFSLITTLFYHYLSLNSEIWKKDNEYLLNIVNLTYRFALPLAWVLLLKTQLTYGQLGKLLLLNKELKVEVREKEEALASNKKIQNELEIANKELKVEVTEKEGALASNRKIRNELEIANGELKVEVIEKEKALASNKEIRNELEIANGELIRQRVDMNHAIFNSLNNLIEDIEKDKDGKKDNILSRLNHIYSLHHLLHVKDVSRISLFNYLKNICTYIFRVGKYENNFNTRESIKIDKNISTSIKNMRDIGAIIYELTTNAYKASKDKQVLNVEFYQNGGYLFLEVRDEGKGGLKSVAEIPNKGFGLDNIESVIEHNLDGFISLEPKKIGTCFKVGLSLKKLNFKNVN